MKKFFAAVAVATLSLSACTQGVSTKADHIPAQDTISYALGVLVANGIQSQWSNVPFDTIDTKAAISAFAISKPNEQYLAAVSQQLDTIYADVFMSGFREQWTNGKSAIKLQDAEGILNAKAMKKREAEKAKFDALSKKNLEEGKSFLETNSKVEGVITTESGLQYKVIEKGKGKTPKADDVVKCLYKGTLLDGTVFDETSDGEPRVFRVSGVIKGWTEALLMMPVGSKWQLYIPAELAYGEHAPSSIGPNQTLIFDIELVDIENNK